jgi:SAM-dependent methyltransferase
VTDTYDPLDDARAIVRINLAYTQARLLQTAVQIDLFGALEEQPATEAQIVQRLGLHPRLTRDFLSALIGMGLLRRDGSGVHHNTPGGARLLVPGKPSYIGASILQHARLHYGLWQRFDETLRNGNATSDSSTAAGAVSSGTPDLEHARRFLAHMEAFSGLVAEQLATAFDWSDRKTFVDVGGARGHVAAGLVKAHPHLTGAVFDVPGVEPLFTEHMADLGTTGQVTFHGGDFFAGPVPEADVAVIGHVLHDWPAERRQEILRQVATAVRPGGALLIYDAMLDAQPADPLPYLRSLVCAVIRDGGSEYTVDDCRTWVEEAGFAVTEVKSLATIADDRLLIAIRRG